MIRSLLKSVGALILLLVGYLLLWPVPVDPKAWETAVNPGYTGVFAENNRLGKVKLYGVGKGSGPEDAAVGPDGLVYTGTFGGAIVRLDLATGKVEEFADTRGRPLGMEWGADGFLYVADAYRGLLRVDKTGKVELLADKIEGAGPLIYADDLDVARDGTVYLSQASSKFGAKNDGSYNASLLDLMEHGLYGDVLKWDPRTRKLTVLAGGFSFANGIALSDDEDFVLVVETGAYAVHKIWLKGDKAGKRETIIANLPGFPDNINRAGGNTFWVGLVSPRSAALDGMAGKPFLRKVVQRLPGFMRPKAQRHGFVIRIDAKGKVLDNLQGRPDGYALTTGALPGPKGSLIVTSLAEKKLAVLGKGE